jgi:hypothetical protein
MANVEVGVESAGFFKASLVGCSDAPLMVVVFRDANHQVNDYSTLWNWQRSNTDDDDDDRILSDVGT